jgi:rubrerythrin
VVRELSEKPEKFKKPAAPRRVMFPRVELNIDAIGRDESPAKPSEEYPEKIKKLDLQLEELDRKVELAKKLSEYKKVQSELSGDVPSLQSDVIRGVGDLIKSQAEVSKTQVEVMKELIDPKKDEATKPVIDALTSITNKLIEDRLSQQPGPSLSDQLVVQLLDILKTIALEGKGGEITKYVDTKYEMLGKDLNETKQLLSQVVQEINKGKDPQIMIQQLTTLYSALDKLREPKASGEQTPPQIIVELKKLDMELEKMRQEHDLRLAEFQRKWDLLKDKFDFDKRKELLELQSKTERDKKIVDFLETLTSNIQKALQQKYSMPQEQGSPVNLKQVQCPECNTIFSIEEGATSAVCPKCGAKLEAPSKSTGQ